MRKFDVVIIGAGTAGLTARREVAVRTDNYAVIDDGPLGTTCARVGCMPSKVLIQAANDFHRRFSLKEQGILGAESLTIDREKTMEHVRSLRDRFVRGVKSSLPSWEDKLIRKRAKFVDKNTLDLGDELIQADKIIIATGSSPIIPGPWREFSSHILTTDQIFEQETLPEKMAIIGLGVIGIEIGQALSRLGIDIMAVGRSKTIAGITEPELQSYILKKLSEEMPIYTSGANLTGIDKDNRLVIEIAGKEFPVDKAVIAVGRKPNIDNLGLENLGLKLESGIPVFSQTTFQLEQAKNIFLVGDVTGERAILHEAADEGHIAGYNCVNKVSDFKRRPTLGITFSDPNIATVGKNFSQLKDEGIDFETGFVSFEGQGRSIVKLKEKGMLKIFADTQSGEILGAELFAPDGEHLAHLLACGLALKLTVAEMLTMPFYHPVIEEGLRTALRDTRNKLELKMTGELLKCDDTPIR